METKMGLTAEFFYIYHRKREIIQEPFLAHKRLKNDGIIPVNNGSHLKGIIWWFRQLEYIPFEVEFFKAVGEI